jgi:phenylacetate-CoA ligase
VETFSQWQPEALAQLNRQLFQERVASAIRTFPLYAEKVRNHLRQTMPAPEGRARSSSLRSPGLYYGGVGQSEPIGATERASHIGEESSSSLLSEIDPSQLPIWTKSDQRALFSTLKGPPLPGSFVHASGGSTGVPIQFYMTRESYEWRAAVSDRGYSWAQAEEGRKSYYVWGSPVKPLSTLKKIKGEVQHMLQRRAYCDSFIFDDRRKIACCQAMNRFRPHALVGYAGNLVELALFVRAHPGLLQWKAPTLVTAAEGLQPGQRELLQETLTAEVFMSYGSREFMLIGMECAEHSGYHVNTDTLLVEVVDEAGRPAALGETGRIVVTDLRNDANPFVRYEIGDWGVWTDEPCACGLPFPKLAQVSGRIQEVLLAADGSRQTALFVPHLVKEFGWIKGYQVEQATAGSLRLCVLSDQDPVAQDEAALVRAFRSKLGETTRVEVVRVSALRKSPSGKASIVVQPHRNT